MASSSKIEKILVMDCETTGMFFGTDDPTTNGTQRYESVAWGFIVIDGESFEILDTLYVEIQPSATALWSDKAEEVHGLTRQYLQVNGKEREDAACDIAELLLKHFTDKVIVTAGQNVASFDKPFLKQLLKDHGLMEHFRFSHRCLDTFSVGMTLFGFTDSDQLFGAFNCRQAGSRHNALADAGAVLKVMRTARAMIRK